MSNLLDILFPQHPPVRENPRALVRTGLSNGRKEAASKPKRQMLSPEEARRRQLQRMADWRKRNKERERIYHDTIRKARRAERKAQK